MTDIISPDLAQRIANWRSAGERIVFTNGVFDLLHVGHVTYLEAAKKMGDRLIVGVNSDSSVRSLEKGAERPIHAALDRTRLLEALQVVDLAIVFSDSTPERLIREIAPDVLVKGGDYDPDVRDPGDARYIVGSETVRSTGGSVSTVPLVPGHSTTAILQKSRNIPKE